MGIPQGLDVGPNQGDALRLHGLRQGSRCWRKRVLAALEILGVVVSDADNALFIGTVEVKKVYILLFVDDGSIMCEEQELINFVLNSLKKEFEIVSGKLETFVGMQINQKKM